jgi:hypothetical protein
MEAALPHGKKFPVASDTLQSSLAAAAIGQPSHRCCLITG